jgi:glycosyltransferase involved in cell wall biosynthesis
MPSITAVVPTCNRPLLLQRSLRSIAAQQLVPSEIIVVDDSDERDEDITRGEMQRWGFSEVRVVSNAHAKGASGARNTGAALATGDLLAFLDDDDEWLPSYLAEAVDAITSRKLDVMCADLLCQFDDGIDRQGKTAPDRLLPEIFLIRNPGLGGSNTILRRALYYDVGGFDESLPTCNDRDFGIRLSLCEGAKYGRLPKRLVRFYQHTGPKLCTARGDAMRAGIRRFYEIHSHRMTEAQREEFRANVRFFWGMDEQGEILIDQPATSVEPLLRLLKTRLDEKRPQLRSDIRASSLPTSLPPSDNDSE